MIICIEGIDASGKATHSKVLATRLGAERFAFPDYETLAGKAILGHLKNEWRADSDLIGMATTNALVLQSLMATNRLERGADLRAARARGHVVLDRYDASGIVYGSMDGLDPDWLREVNDQLIVRPDLYLLLDIPVEESFARRPERRDRNERDAGYLERVRVAYLRLFETRQAARARGREGASWVVIGGVGTKGEVAERIWTAVEQKLAMVAA